MAGTAEKRRKIRLLAVDMDGTCLDRRSRMTEETVQALREAAEAGIMVVPTTGRNLHCLPHRLLQEKNLYRYVICSNGASVHDCARHMDLFQALIPRQKAAGLLAACKRAGAGVTVRLHHEYLVQGRLLMLMGRLLYGKDAGGVRHVRNMIRTVQNSRYEPEEIQLYYLLPGTRARLEKILRRQEGLLWASASIYVEIFAAEATKGKALSELAKHLGIRKEEIACIGDGENDLPMFRAAGFRMAMGNAVPDLKKHADVILPANYQNGAAEGIRRYLLAGKDRGNRH